MKAPAPGCGRGASAKGESKIDWRLDSASRPSVQAPPPWTGATPDVFGQLARVEEYRKCTVRVLARYFIDQSGDVVGWGAVPYRGLCGRPDRCGEKLVGLWPHELVAILGPGGEA